MTERRNGSGMAHESFEVRAKWLAAWTLGVLLIIAALLAGVLALNELFAALEPANPMSSAHHEISQIPAPPRLQNKAHEELRALITEKRLILNSYGWRDRQAGVAHIPIQRAMELMAKRDAMTPSPQGKPSP